MQTNCKNSLLSFLFWMDVIYLILLHPLEGIMYNQESTIVASDKLEITSHWGGHIITGCTIIDIYQQDLIHWEPDLNVDVQEFEDGVAISEKAFNYLRNPWQELPQAKYDFRFKLLDGTTGMGVPRIHSKGYPTRLEPWCLTRDYKLANYPE